MESLLSPFNAKSILFSVILHFCYRLVSFEKKIFIVPFSKNIFTSTNHMRKNSQISLLFPFQSRPIVTVRQVSFVRSFNAHFSFSVRFCLCFKFKTANRMRDFDFERKIHSFVFVHCFVEQKNQENMFCILFISPGFSVCFELG